MAVEPFAEPPKPVSSAFERDDIELVKLFLAHYKDVNGNWFTLETRPDVAERNKPAVEAIAVAENGLRLAIEHTYIQPFERQRSDDRHFLAVFEQLRTDSSFKVPNRFYDVLAPAFAIPRGVDRRDVAKCVRDWFVSARNKLPVEGQTWCVVPGLTFELKVLVDTMDLPETDGVVVVGRILPSNGSFEKVLRTAIKKKVPKLVEAPADQRVLLLEDGGTAIGFTKLTIELDEIAKEFSDLKKIDAVWTVHTTSWKSNGDALFVYVWPGGVREKFWIKDQRFSEQKPAGLP